ncbi:MAG: hypothetical protein RRZ24_07785 [Clostridia bacterium]
MKRCILEEKICDNCGHCDDRCELDPQKICDNCFRCLDEMVAQPYIDIPISGVYTEDDFIPDEPMVIEKAHYIDAHTLYGLSGERRRKSE